MTTTMKLDAIAPAYLEARADVEAAKERLRAVSRRPGDMASGNDEHAAEVAAKGRTGYPLATNGQALRRGSGSGYEIIYSRCRHSGFPPDECECDPRESPHSAADIANAEKTVRAATLFVKDAEKRLAATSSDWDAFAAAREAECSHVWWPADAYVDPRLRRYRGQPLTVDEVQALGPHALNRGIQSGGILEVPS